MAPTPKAAFRPSRRDALKILAVGGVAGAAWGLGWLNRSWRASAHRSRRLMGTVVNLTVLGDDQEAADAAVESTLTRMSDIEALLTRYREDSEVSRLNSGQVVQASDELLDVLALADRVHRLGDGAFDVSIQPLLDLYRTHLREHHQLPSPQNIESALSTVGSRGIRVDGRTVSLEPGASITLDGIGKGYVVDRGVEELKERGFADVLVEAGGDLVAAGEKASGDPWRLGIKSPRAGLTLQARFDARDRAVATSGDYMQPFTPDLAQHHILDPRTGYSAPDLASSTVIARDGATADALATLTMVLGPREGRELIEGLSDCEGYFVSKDLEVVRTSGFALA